MGSARGCGNSRAPFLNGLCKSCFHKAYRGCATHRLAKKYVERKKKALIRMSADALRSYKERRRDIERQIATCEAFSMDASGHIQEMPTANKQYVLKNHHDVLRLFENQDIFHGKKDNFCDVLRHCGFYFHGKYRGYLYWLNRRTLRDRQFEVARVKRRSKERAIEIKRMQRLTDVPALDSLLHLTPNNVWFARLTPGIWRCRVVAGDPCYAKPQEVIVNGFPLLDMKAELRQGTYGVGEATFSFVDGIARVEGLMSDKRKAARLCTVEFFPIRFFERRGAARECVDGVRAPLRVSFGPNDHKVPDGFVVESGAAVEDAGTGRDRGGEEEAGSSSRSIFSRPGYGWPYNDSVVLSSRARKNEQRAREILRYVNERTLSGSRLLLTAAFSYMTRFVDDGKGPLTVKKELLGDVYSSGILGVILRKYVGPNLNPVSDRRRLRYPPSLWIFRGDRTTDAGYAEIGGCDEQGVHLRFEHAVSSAILKKMKLSAVQFNAALAKEILATKDGQSAFRVWLAYRNVPGFSPHSAFWRAAAASSDLEEDVCDTLRDAVRRRALEVDLPVTTAIVREGPDVDRFAVFDAMDHALDIARRDLDNPDELGLDEVIEWHKSKRGEKDTAQHHSLVDEKKNTETRGSRISGRTRPHHDEYSPAFRFRRPLRFRAQCDWDSRKFEKQTLGGEDGVYEAVFGVEEKPGWLRVIAARRAKAGTLAFFASPRFVPLENRNASKRLLVLRATDSASSSLAATSSTFRSKRPDTSNRRRERPDSFRAPPPSLCLDSGFALGFTVEAFILRFDRHDVSNCDREVIVAAPCPIGHTTRDNSYSERSLAWELALSEKSQLEFTIWTREKKIYLQSHDSACLRGQQSPCENCCRGPRTISAGRWTHVAASFDGVSLRLYVDGRLEGKSSKIIADPRRSSPVRRHGTRTGEPTLVVGSFPTYDKAFSDKRNAFYGKVLLISVAQEALGPREFLTRPGDVPRAGLAGCS